MASIIAIVVSVALTILAFVTHPGNELRDKAFRRAALGLLLAALIRETDLTNIPFFDLLKRFGLLILQLHLILLLLSFVTREPSRRTTKTLTGVAIGLAVVQTAFAFFLPHHPNGDVFLPAEVIDAGSVGGTGYYIVYLSAPAIAILFAAVILIAGIVRRQQSALVRASLIMMLLGTISAGAFITTSFINLFDPYPQGVQRMHMGLFVISIFAVLIGLMIGFVGSHTQRLYQLVTIRTAAMIADPLWKLTTSLQPEVRLPLRSPDELPEFHTLTRMIVETHDALTLIRSDPDDAFDELLAHSNSQAVHDAALLKYLTGPRSLPPLFWWQRVIARAVFVAQRKNPLHESLDHLYEIRIAYPKVTSPVHA